MGYQERTQSPTLYGVPMKHVSLITLTFQNSALILIMHYSRIMPLNGGQRYFTSTAVFLNELIKLALSLTIALYDISRTLPSSTPATVLFGQLADSVFSGDGWKLAIPATLYTLQNTLQYVAVSNLDAVHFQILYQLKIFTTALFSVLILRRTLSSKRWISLVLLTVGVIIVQLPAAGSSYADISISGTGKLSFPRSFHEFGQIAEDAAVHLTRRGMEMLGKRSATYEGIEDDLGLNPLQMNYSLGCISVLAASVISGLTGVYFEKVLKDSSTSTTVWTRNVQLSFYSLFPALLGCVYKDGGDIARDGFFAGYCAVVWTAIGLQAVGGVLVAMCINYADNIAKNFATSISILISFVFSVWFFDFSVTFNFVLGTALVLYATYLYSAHDTRRGSRPPPITIASYEKTTIDNGYTPTPESKNLLDPMDLLQGTKSAALSTSRPNSPMRSHSRQGRSKRDD